MGEIIQFPGGKPIESDPMAGTTNLEERPPPRARMQILLEKLQAALQDEANAELGLEPSSLVVVVLDPAELAVVTGINLSAERLESAIEAIYNYSYLHGET